MSKSKVSANSVIGENLVPGSQPTVFSVCPHMVEVARDFSWVSFITRTPPS